MQTVNRNELFGEVECRSEMVDTAIERVRVVDIVIVLLTAEPENAGSGGEYAVPFIGALCIRRSSLALDDAPQDIGEDLVVRPEEPVPVAVHADVQRLVIEQLWSPFDGMDFRDLGGDDKTRCLEEFFGRDFGVSDCLFRVGRIAQAGIGVRSARRCRRNSSTKELCSRANRFVSRS